MRRRTPANKKPRTIRPRALRRSPSPTDGSRPWTDWLQAVSNAVTTLVAVGALVFTGVSLQQSRAQSQIAVEEQRLTEQGQITDRYARAVEQLGSDSTEVRIGSLYALRRLAADSPADRATIQSVVMAFINGITSGKPEAPEKSRPGWAGRRGDLIAAVEVHGALTQAQDRIRLLVTDFSLQSVRLHRSYLENADLSKTDLGGADLSGAQMQFTSLGEANLAGANAEDSDLSSADLTTADLTGANLRRANLEEANFFFGTLVDANLSEARLHKAVLKQVIAERADLTGADLTDSDMDVVDLIRAVLVGADARGATIQRARLGSSNLSSARFNNANMSGAYLDDADLTHADLRGADLTDANLTRAVLRGTDLRQAILTNSNLTHVCYDSTTQWPAGFNPPQAPDCP